VSREEPNDGGDRCADQDSRIAACRGHRHLHHRRRCGQRLLDQLTDFESVDQLTDVEPIEFEPIEFEPIGGGRYMARRQEHRPRQRSRVRVVPVDDVLRGRGW